MRDNVAFLKLLMDIMDINVIFTGQIGIGRVLFHIYRQELTKAMLGAKKDISYNPLKENQVY